MIKVHRQSRHAAVLVAALVCLLIALSIATTMIAETLARRAQLPVEARARQADLLVQAGHGRAAARLALDADYSGESWTPELGATAATVTATVEISVEAIEDRATQVTVVVVYPEGDAKAIRRSRVFSFTSANLSAEE